MVLPHEEGPEPPRRRSTEATRRVADAEAVATDAMARTAAAKEKVALLEAEAQEAIRASQQADASMPIG